ncbi:MAG: hypothetical protein NTU61_02245 [Candidatus Altiarchaeota archaeon]|nr:hypothetical protein [Candidatus Altiarchaeota archaeon]
MASKKVSAKHKNKIGAAIKSAEQKLVDNYKKVSHMSGEDWRKVSKKYKEKAKKDMAQARKKVNTAIRKNPEGATIAAAIIGAIAGALIMSKLRKR